MNLTTDWLSAQVIEFVAILNNCLFNSTYVEDRELFARDIAMATTWLNRLKDGEQATAVASEIVEPATAKHFTDYWRQGTWGEDESAALASLQESIRHRLPS